MTVARRFAVYLVVMVLYVVAVRVAGDGVLGSLVHVWVPLFTIAIVALVESALWWQGREDR